MTNLIRSSVKQKAELGSSVNRYTVSQVITYFAADLPKASNYPRNARTYLEYCLGNGYGVDAISLSLYAAGLKPNRISPIRKFLFFYQWIGQPLIIPDGKSETISPAANSLVLRFMRDAKNLRGDKTKETYTKALNAFFRFMDQQALSGIDASLSGQTVSDFVSHLKTDAKSAFTINLYLSAVKQLATWCIQKREELHLTDSALNALRDIAYVKGFAIERTFYKDSLDATQRDQLLDNVDSARDLAVLGLLSLEGLRTVEVTRLKLADVEVEKMQLLILGKGKSTRKAVKLFKGCLNLLQTYLTEKGQWPIDATNAKKWLFPDLDGGPLETYQIRYIVTKHLKNNNLKSKGMSAHSLRHTTGQLLLEMGVSLEHVQQHLRHETLETTQFYTKKRTQQTYFDQMPE